MKPHSYSLLHIVKRGSFNLASIMVIAAAGCVLPASLAAQQRSLQVIPNQSKADLYLGSRDNPTSFTAGTARVSGNVELNSEDISSSVFNLTVYAANRTPEDPAGAASISGGDQPAITFQSQRATLRSDDSLEVAGKLTVTRVSRNAVVNPGESYSGPEYGPPEISNTSREATLVFTPFMEQPAPGDSDPEGPQRGVALLEARQPQRPAVTVLTATATVNGETFPELSTSVANTVWPMLVNNEECTGPSSVGEDHSGAICSGMFVDSLAPAVKPAQAGEDYAGVHQVQPLGNQVTMQFHLALAIRRRPLRLVPGVATPAPTESPQHKESLR